MENKVNEFLENFLPHIDLFGHLFLLLAFWGYIIIPSDFDFLMDFTFVYVFLLFFL